MKTFKLVAGLAFVSLFAVSAVACAADSDEEDVGQSEDSLISRPPTGGGTNYACSLRECYNKCVDGYPTGGGPLATCKKLCDISSTCGDLPKITRY